MKSITLKYVVGDVVSIISLENAIGRVVAVHLSLDGIQYYIRYFQDGKANEVYFYEDELTSGDK